MTHTPKFTQASAGEATENQGDEERILGDQDQTVIEGDIIPVEEEPEDFMRGEVDVKSQMDRAAREMDAAIRGRRGPDPGP